MTLETFFDKFDNLSDAPNALAKMRELILQLAAHGKLVEQSCDDEPASALVGRIEKHFETLRSRKELRGSPVEPLDRAELPEIPLSWEWVRLGNVVDYGSSDKAESADIPEDAWLLDLEDIEKDTSRLLQRKTFRDSPSKSTKTAFADGDVLYGKLRPYLNKVIVADASGYCTTEIIPIRAFGFIEPAYLCQTLKRPEFIAYANSKSYGMNLPRLGTEDARSAPFPLPPLAEQRRIVAKVDELMALCDRLAAQHQERETRQVSLARASLARFADAPTPANLNFLFHESYTIEPADLRKSILTLAVQGKLIPQDPNDEPADTIFKRVAEERRNNIEQSGADAPGALGAVKENEEPFQLPPSWRWVRLGDIASIKHGFAFSSDSFTSEPTLFVLTTPGNFHETGGFRDRGQKTKYYDGSVPPGFILKAGDLIIPMTEQAAGLLGSPAFIPDDGKTYLHNQRLGKLSFYSESIAPEFVFWFFNCEFFRDELARNCTGMKVRHTSPKRILKVLFPLCSLAEQHRIVAKVEQLMALVDALETQLAASRATAANLLDAVVAELTTQA